MTAPAPSVPWWRDRRARERVAVTVFAALALAGILIGGVSVFLRGDVREMVVTLENGAGQEAREGLKAACGGLPGVSVVPDRGNSDPRVQGRFPVRFAIGGITDQQQSELIRCLNENGERFQVVGYLPERDGN